jgi:hypothetical protein
LPIRLHPHTTSLVTSHYATPFNYGPYNIVNAVVHACNSPYLAIQDADDESLSDRLWKQIAQLQLGFVMTSAAMKQIPVPTYTGTRHLVEPVIYPGERFSAAPLGRCINSTRTMLKQFFIEQNGFASMPCSGDFHFDNRCTFQHPHPPIHASPEILGLRYLRPESLSNNSVTGGGTPIRHAAALRVIEDINTMRANPTLAQSQALGSLSSFM